MGRSIGRLGRCIGLPRCKGRCRSQRPRVGIGPMVQRLCRGAEADRCTLHATQSAVVPSRKRSSMLACQAHACRASACCGARWRAACGGVCVRGSPPNLYGRPRLRLRAALPGSICLARRRCCWAAGRVWLALTSCVMSLTMLRASRRTAPSFPFSHASYSFSESESDLLPDSILRAQPPSSAAHGGTAVVDVAV